MNSSLFISLFGASQLSLSMRAAKAAAKAAGGTLLYSSNAGSLAGSVFTDVAATTPAAAGDQLAAWVSREGLAKTGTQATAASRPVLTTLANGVIAPVFDSTNDALSVDTGLTSGVRTVIVAGTKSSLTGGTYIFDGPSASPRFTAYAEATGAVTMYGGTLLSSAAGVVAANTPFVGVFVFNGASSQIWINDAQVASGNTGVGEGAVYTVGNNYTLTSGHRGPMVLFAVIPGALTAAQHLVYRTLARNLIAGA